MNPPLWVMKKNADGDRAMLSGAGRVGGGVDQDYAIESIDIENDGGDW